VSAFFDATAKPVGRWIPDEVPMSEASVAPATGTIGPVELVRAARLAWYAMGMHTRGVDEVNASAVTVTSLSPSDSEHITVSYSPQERPGIVQIGIGNRPAMAVPVEWIPKCDTLGSEPQ
jgi:hypothetical protein